MLTPDTSIDVAVDRAEKIAQLCRLNVISMAEAQKLLSNIREGLDFPRENADLKWPTKEERDGNPGNPGNPNR